MKNTIKKSVLSIMMAMALIITTILPGIGVRAEDMPGTTETSYQVTIKQVDGGTVSSDKETYLPEETVQLQIQVEEGYQLSGLKSDPEVEVSETYSFVIPEQDVVITPQFEKLVTEESKAPEEKQDTSDQKETTETEPTEEKKTESEQAGNIPETDAAVGSNAYFRAVGIVYKGKVSYKGTTVGDFTLNGNQAFCMEHLKPTPDTGTPFHSEVYDNPNIRKALYYGWKGTEQWSGFKSRAQGIVCTSLALSYYYSGPDSIGMKPHGSSAKKLGLSDFFNFLDKQSDPKVNVFNLSKSNLTASLSPDKTYQMTEDVTFNADSKNTITIPLKAGMSLVNKTTGQTGTGNVKIKGGDTFYLKAPITMNETWTTGKLQGSMGNFQSVLAITDSPSLQNLGYGKWASDPSKTVQLTVKFNAVGRIDVQKVDSETEQTTPQGSASFQGAEYTLYTDEGCTTQAQDINGNPVVLTTGADGKSALSGNLVFGTYYLKETKAPEGYLISDEVFKVVLPTTGNDPLTVHVTAKEDVIRGNLEIIKIAENEDPEDDTLHGLEGAEFTIVSKTTGEEWVITSDKDGVATTVNEEYPRGTLPFDTYTITERKTPEGYETIQPFDVTIKDEGVLLRGIYKEDKLITTPISVVKVDASTGKTIPLANTEFQLLDENKQVITMTTHYPNTVVHETFKTDENGQLTFPEKLKYGTYYLREVNAPNGYLLNGEELQFTVTESGEWENPQVVRFSDENAMGKINIKKLDKTTDKVIPSGAEFTITAAEDITTPDGTIRAEKGEIVDTLVTDTTGRAESTELFLGKYLVKETKAPEGYVLNKKEFKVTLKYADQNTAIVYKDVTVKDQPAMGKINVSKIDATTGKPISVAATFEIRAAEDIITPDGTIRAKAGELVDTVKTKKDGTAQSKKLHLGAYTVQEVAAPEGYLLSDEIHNVTLSYEDQNTAVVYESVTAEDAPVMGKIQIQKVDLETAEPLAGAVFEITAKEDIVTPDGTVRAEKGEVVDTITSGEDGTIESKELFLGTYVVTETKQPAGYLLPKESWEVTLSYQDQVTPIVIETLEIENQPTVVIIDKKVTGSEERLSGVKFAVWNKAMGEDDVDPGMEVKETFTTARNGQIRITNLLPGTYCVQEVEGIPGYGMDTEIREFTINEDGRIDGEDEITITVENAKSDIHTTAKDQATGINQAIARENTTIVDTVAYENLKPGKEYTIQGVLMNKTTEEELLVNGKTVTAEKTFTPETANGTVDLEFTFDSRALKGNAVVAFESLYEDEIEVATHADISDEGQTIEFPKHEIHTTARDQDSGTNTAQTKKETTIIDTVEYKNLIVGQEYTMKGILMDQSTGEALLVNGKTVTAETTFVAEQPNGSMEMKFTFDSSALQGKAVVVFENLYQDGTLVATHADLSDKGQTVTFQKEVPPAEKEDTVKTSDANTPFMFAGIMMMSAAVILMIYLKKKDKKETK